MAIVSEIERKYRVHLTEQTVKELLRACKDTKKQAKIPYEIKVASEFASTEFKIRLEKEPNTQESVGYKKTDELYDQDLSEVSITTKQK